MEARRIGDREARLVVQAGVPAFRRRPFDGQRQLAGAQLRDAKWSHGRCAAITSIAAM
jgi:hypothetical protein